MSVDEPSRTSWREFVIQLNPAATFAPPVAPEQIAEAESVLGSAFPADLRDLLLETNGICVEYDCFLIWPLERIVRQNVDCRTKEMYRELYMPLHPLLFFADAGNGDMFGYSIVNGKVREDDVFTWNHEDDSRTCVAYSLERFLKGWSSSTIAI